MLSTFTRWVVVIVAFVVLTVAVTDDTMPSPARSIAIVTGLILIVVAVGDSMKYRKR
jgi:hypothetical protein